MKLKMERKVPGTLPRVTIIIGLNTDQFLFGIKPLVGCQPTDWDGRRHASNFSGQIQ